MMDGYKKLKEIKRQPIKLDNMRAIARFADIDHTDFGSRTHEETLVCDDRKIVIVLTVDYCDKGDCRVEGVINLEFEEWVDGLCVSNEGLMSDIGDCWLGRVDNLQYEFNRHWNETVAQFKRQVDQWRY